MSQATLLASVAAGITAAGASISVITFKDEIKFERKIVLNDSSGVITKYKELQCAKDLFEKIIWVSPTKNSEVKTKIESKTITLTKDSTKGCLSVWWQKEKHGEYWRGIWNILWAVRDDKYGTIFISTIIANDGKIQVDKSIYLLDKQQSEKWTTIGHWSKDKVNASNSNSSDLIIYPDKSIPEKKNGWDFIKDGEFDKVSEKVCSKDKLCNNSYPEITYTYLNWKYTQKEVPSEYTNCQAHEWSKNMTIFKNGTNGFDENIKDIYANTKGYYKLENH